MKRCVVVLSIVVMFVFSISAPNVLAQGGPCTADFTCDQDVDGEDLTAFLNQFGRGQYSDPCPDCYDSPCPCTPCEGTLSAGGRWCDQGDGTVKDTTTGLVWLKKADWGGLYPLLADLSFPDAHSRAAELWDGSPFEGSAALSDGSVEGDWRLPTKTELDNLANGTEAVRASSMQLFTGVQSDIYWSSTTVADENDSAWVVNMDDGFEDFSFKDDIEYVWPVRGGH